jgi:hypothetical protein
MADAPPSPPPPDRLDTDDGLLRAASVTNQTRNVFAPLLALESVARPPLARPPALPPLTPLQKQEHLREDAGDVELLVAALKTLHQIDELIFDDGLKEDFLARLFNIRGTIRRSVALNVVNYNTQWKKDMTADIISGFAYIAKKRKVYFSGSEVAVCAGSLGI